MPEQVRAIMAKHLNRAAMDMRTDGSKLNATLRPELSAKGLIFNDPKLSAFQEQLTRSGFYAEWKKNYGEEAWALLEKHTGKLG
jgi:TRAP-type C4-dicarboxylate transport system substrate-binding protein